MGIGEAMQSWEDHYRAQMRFHTYGHLAPTPGKSYCGYIVFVCSAWGVQAPVDAEFDGLPASPWFHEDMLEFIGKHGDDAVGVFRFDGTYTKFKNGNYRFSGRTRKINTETQP